MPVKLVSNEEPLPGYRLQERLGRGGFGEVWRVEAPGGLLKAMKFVFGDLDASDEDSRPAEQELKALKRVQTIRHPYVLSLERYDIIDGQLMIVMELADENLWDRFRRCRSQGLPGIPRDELLRYMEETAEALDLMNNHYQIQHLDVKPQNLFIVFNHVKVGDFGLAKLLEGVRATVTGGVTPVYAAPETFEGYVSRFSDQYSLAIVFQELLTGTRPFNGANTRQLLMQHLNGTPELNSLPVADRAVIARALSKKPDDRWPTCTEMVRALKYSGLPAPPPTPTSDHTPRRRPADAEGSPSEWATRVQVGGSGRLGSDPAAKDTTPVPRPAGPIGPMPGLVTVGPAGTVVPRLVTPGSSTLGPAPAVTLLKPDVVQTQLMNAIGLAPPEKAGDGVLFPALVVAVGGIGRQVADQLRQVIADRYGNTDKVPNIRFVAIDTDPAVADQPGETAGTHGLVLARLNRSVHYLQRDGLPPVDQWLPPGTLYKLPRSPVAAAGVRAFGRLALVDHYRAVAQRLRQEIGNFQTDEPLAKADKATQLGLRTNRPRAYVLAGLGGGTGSGMFLDLAFIIRQELRAVGYVRPEVAGVFLVPPAEKHAPRTAALGNTHAALTELYHYQARKTKYVTTFDRSEAPIQDGEAPFARVAVQVLPKGVDPKGRTLAAGRAARALFNELLTPAGRVTDELRDIHRNAFPSPTPVCQSFGLFRLTWPRPEVLAAATRRFAMRLTKQWAAKDAGGLKEPIRAWLDSQWAERKLTFEHVVEGFEAAARSHLREEPERVIDAFIDPLRTRTPSGSRMEVNAVLPVVEQLLAMVGRPDAEDDAQRGVLHAPLMAQYEKWAREAESHLATMTVTFIEQPQYRLAGAEEAVRQVGDRLKRQIDALEPIHADLTRQAKSDYSKMLQALAALNEGRWKAAATSEVLDLLRLYPRSKLRLMILTLCLSAYRKLLGSTPEYLREVSMCRAGLDGFHAALDAGAAAGSAGPGKLILPDGCATLDDAADRFLAGLNPDDVLDFDARFQKEVARKFRGLAGVCLKPNEKGPVFRELLTTRSREFLDGRLDAADPATVFFRNRTGSQADHSLIAEAFDGAAPDLPGTGGVRPEEVTVLAAPPGPDGDRFRKVVAEAIPSVEFTAAPLADDIAFYREYPRVELAALPQLGQYGREALALLQSGDHPPHTRGDVVWTPVV
ncbi:MAG: tubulin-like doman-containing protein [Gemmataceae bacterium]